MEQKITIPEGYELQKVNNFEYRIVKKEAELPNSWEEFCKTHPINEEEAWINDFGKVNLVGSRNGRNRDCIWFNLLPNEAYAEAILSLIQLIQLRDCYRQGWKPDFKNTKTKWCVVFEWDALRIDPKGCNNNIFAFQDEKLAEKFLINFKDLIEKTKPLFM